MCNDAVYQGLHRFSKDCYCYFKMYYTICELS